MRMNFSDLKDKVQSLFDLAEKLRKVELQRTSEDKIYLVTGYLIPNDMRVVAKSSTEAEKYVKSMCPGADDITVTLVEYVE